MITQYTQPPHLQRKKNDLDFEQSLLSDKVRCANQKKKIAQIKIDVSKPLGKVTLEKYFSCPSLLEFRTVCFHQFVFPLVFFFNSRDRLRKKAGTVRCLLGNIFRLGTARAPEDFFFFWGGGDLMDFRGNVGG